MLRRGDRSLVAALAARLDMRESASGGPCGAYKTVSARGKTPVITELKQPNSQPPPPPPPQITPAFPPHSVPDRAEFIQKPETLVRFHRAPNKLAGEPLIYGWCPVPRLGTPVVSRWPELQPHPACSCPWPSGTVRHRRLIAARPPQTSPALAERYPRASAATPAGTYVLPVHCLCPFSALSFFELRTRTQTAPCHGKGNAKKWKNTHTCTRSHTHAHTHTLQFGQVSPFSCEITLKISKRSTCVHFEFTSMHLFNCMIPEKKCIDYLRTETANQGCVSHNIQP